MNRLSRLPLDGECNDNPNVEFNDNAHHTKDLGPAPEQVDPDETDSVSHSSVLQPNAPVIIQYKTENVVKQVLGKAAEVSFNRQNPGKHVTVVQFLNRTTTNFFTLGFRAFFPYGSADLFSNRPRTCSYMSDWAVHLLLFFGLV